MATDKRSARRVGIASRVIQERQQMRQGERGNEERRAIEALAQALYEAEDPAGIAWVKRAQTVRQPWIVRARQQLRGSERASETEARRQTDHGRE